MAFSAALYDQARRTRYFRLNQRNVPLDLPFDLVTVDFNDQYYEPVSRGRVDVRGVPQRGVMYDVVYVNGLRGVPNAPPGGKSEQYRVQFFGTV